jgi:hypothetical protein
MTDAETLELAASDLTYCANIRPNANAADLRARAARLRAIAAKLAAPTPAGFEEMVGRGGEAFAALPASEAEEIDTVATAVLTAAGVPALLAERDRLRELLATARDYVSELAMIDAALAAAAPKSEGR